MKQITYILTLLLLLAACNSAKKVTSEKTEVKTSDTSTRTDKTTQQSTKETNTTKESRDSTYKVPERKTGKDLKPEDLQPVYQKNGKAASRTHRFEDKGVHGTVTIDTNGNVRADCVCDELEFTVRQMERTITESKASESYWREMYERSKSAQSIKTESKTKIVKEPWYGWIMKYAAVILLAIYAWKGLYQIIKFIAKRYGILL